MNIDHDAHCYVEGCADAWPMSLPPVPEKCTSPLLKLAIQTFRADLSRLLAEGREGQYVAYRGQECLGFGRDKSSLIRPHREAYRRKELLVAEITVRHNEPVMLNRY